jgi:hypothetical protein
MRQAALRRAVVRRAKDLVRVEALDMLDIGRPGWSEGLEGPLDGVLSDFGGLNAVRDRRRLLGALAGVVRPGGRVVLIVMGPLCPAEIAWHLLHGEPAAAARRWRSGGTARVDGGGRLRVWYPTAYRVAREAAPWFDVRHRGGIGVALPPTGLAHAFERRRWWLRVLGPAERRAGASVLGAWCSDHWALDLVRRDG